MESLGLAQFTGKDNTNMARLMEKQRLYASVLGAKWVVLKTQGDIPLITNDLGYAPFYNSSTRDKGLAIPINLDHILIVAPKLRNKIAIGLGGIWWPLIEYSTTPENSYLELNKTISKFSQRFIFGPENDIIRKYLYFQEISPPIPEPSQWGFMSGQLAMVYEMTWYNLITVLSTPPVKDGDFIYVDYRKNARNF